MPWASHVPILSLEKYTKQMSCFHGRIVSTLLQLSQLVNVTYIDESAAGTSTPNIGLGDEDVQFPISVTNDALSRRAIGIRITRRTAVPQGFRWKVVQPLT